MYLPKKGSNSDLNPALEINILIRAWRKGKWNSNMDKETLELLSFESMSKLEAVLDETKCSLNATADIKQTQRWTSIFSI